MALPRAPRHFHTSYVRTMRMTPRMPPTVAVQITKITAAPTGAGELNTWSVNYRNTEMRERWAGSTALRDGRSATLNNNTTRIWTHSPSLPLAWAGRADHLSTIADATIEPAQAGFSVYGSAQSNCYFIWWIWCIVARTRRGLLLES